METDQQRPVAQAHGLPLAIWRAWWRPLMLYHRYEVHGLDRLPDGSALVVGYHGRPAAWDLCMLMMAIYQRDGYLPHGIFHATFRKIPFWSWLIDGVGGVYGDDERMAQVLERGEHIVTAPGGTMEGYRSFRHRYEVCWGERAGYVRFAIKYGLPIVPVGASGVDDMYIGLNDGYRLGKRVGMPGSVPLWLGFGLTGVSPLSLPFPVKVRQLIGEPIRATADGSVDRDDAEAVAAVHQQVKAAVQDLLDRARAL